MPEKDEIKETTTEPTTEKLRNSLFIVQNGQPVEMSIEDIFDTNHYDQFKGVTYSASGNFVNKYLTKFKKIRLITGAGNSAMENAIYKTLSAPTQNVFQIMKRNVSHESSNLYQALSDYSKELLVNHDFELRVPVKALIHSKFYLLSNSDTNENRLIIGSANLSNQAFNKNIQQFETVMIFDNHQLYDQYNKYFEDDLYPTTGEFFSKAYVNEAKKKLKQKPKELEVSDVAEYTISTPDTIKELESKSFKENLEDLSDDKNKAVALITPQVLGKMKDEVEDKASTIKDVDKQAQKDDNTVYELMADSVSLRGKKPKIKTPTALTNTYKKHVHVQIVEDVGNDVAERQAELIDKPSMRRDNKTGLMLEQSDHKLLPFGQPSDKEEIRHNLDALQHLMTNYLQFTVDGNEQYCSRIMEAILYAFEAPFLWEVRQKAAPDIEGQDIPQFLFLGGQANSGKSSLLKILMKMLGIYKSDTPQLYTQIIPEGVSRAKSLTIKQIKSWIASENVAPIISDEVPDYFFTTKQYGNDLVVDATNITDSNQQAFPVFIGSTNSSDYSFPDRARRRTYYLSNDRPFDKEYRQEAGKQYNDVLDSMNSNLFNDFCVRFSELLATKDDAFWKEYGNTSDGLYDFLRPARLIFESYYKECGLPIPKWFPKARYNDEQESGKDKWKKLYEANPEWFKTNPSNKNHMFFTINNLNANSKSNWSQMTPAEEYRNDLEPKVVIGNKNSMQIELDKQRFLDWVGIKPKHKFLGLF